MSDTATATADAGTVTQQTTQAATQQTASTQQTTTAVQQPWFTEWIQSDGKLNAKALDRLPDHLKPLKSTWERAGSIEDLGTSSLNQQFLLGKKALAPLPADAPKEIVAERKALMDTIRGVPKEAKDYGITRPADFPEKHWDPEAAQMIQDWSHETSTAPADAKRLVAKYAAIVQKQIAAQQQYETKYWADEQIAFDAEIRTANIPAERANALVEKGAQALGWDVNDPQTKIFLQGKQARLGAMRHAMAIGEDNASAPAGGNAVQPDPAAAAADIRSNAANPLNAPFWNKEGKYSRAQQDAAVEKHSELLRIASARKK